MGRENGAAQGAVSTPVGRAHLTARLGADGRPNKPNSRPQPHPAKPYIPAWSPPLGPSAAVPGARIGRGEKSSGLA